MLTPIRALIVEDSEDDAELLLRELRRAGYAPDYRRVDTPEEFVAALDEGHWDVILSDFSMPRFSGTQALKLVRGKGLDVPFIFVSGTIGEETAVAAMKSGANDYVVKGNLARLVPAIEREIRDVTLRREAEAKLRQLSRAVEQSANLVFIITTDGAIEYLNPRVLSATGYAAEELIGRNISLFRPPDHDPQVYASLLGSISAGREWRGEMRNRRKDGSVMQVLATISPIKDESGRITHFISIQEDVTQLKDTEEQLRRSQRLEAIGQMTGGLAHDFNNLLTVVIGNLDLLVEQLAGDPRHCGLAKSALAAGLRGATLTRQLLAFARRQSLEATVFDLNALAGTTMDLLRRTLGEHVEVRMQLAKELWTTFADPSQVESALANLAINARDAMAKGGRLTVETANVVLDARYAAENPDVAAGEYTMLAVSDTGTGILPEVLDRVFEPFFTTKPQGKGTGLGLSMVYGFAKQSQGHVKVSSTVGVGTTVRLYLPKGDPGAGAAVEDAGEAAGAAPRGATVLLVEDNADVRAVAAQQLAGFGYAVIEAEDAAQALVVLREEREIDLLFTDVVMPGGMSGIELAREARALRPGLRVLLASGHADVLVRNDARSGEVGRFLRKPYRKHDLARALSEMFSNGV
jgi:PAS domain S-box-containing protein